MSAWRAPLIPFAVAFATGIALEPVGSTRGWWLVWLGAVGLAALALTLGAARVAVAALVPAALALGALRAVPAPIAADDLAVLTAVHPAEIEARVLADPVRFAPNRQRLLLDVDQIDGRPGTGRIFLTVYGRAPEIWEGYRIRAEARLRPASGFRNPDGFDYGAFLAREGVHVLGTAVASRVRILDEASPWHARVRRHALTAMHATLPPASAALLGGLVLGARTDVPPEILESFRRAGVFHVLAVSGFHVGLVAGAVFTAVLLTGLPRATAAVIAMAAIVGYAAVVGPRPSVLRALIMGVLVLTALLLARESSVLNSLALAAIVILAWRPEDLFNPGFQLSFAATAGIVLAPLPRPMLLGALGVSLAAQLAVLPITLSHFNQFSTAGIVANLGVVPLAAVATVGGFGAVALTALSETAAGWTFNFVWPVLLAMRAMVWLAGGLPGALIHLPAPHWSANVLYVGALLLGLAAWHARARRPRAALAGGLAAAMLLSVAVGVMLWPVVRPGDGWLRVAVLDVGQADAIVVETPDRRTVVIAGPLGGHGRFDLGERVVAPYLWNRGILSVDALVATADDDSAGGIGTLRRLFGVAARDTATAGLGGSGAEGLDVPGALGPLSITLVRRGVSPADGNNDDRLVGVRLAYGRASFLLLFEGAREAERALAASGDGAEATVLKPGRHGSRRATSDGLLAAVRPQVAILSVGARNPHGHPDPETLDRLAAAGADIYRTDRDGAVILETDGEVLDVTAWGSQRTRRYCLTPEAAEAACAPRAVPDAPARIREPPPQGDRP